MPIVKNINDTQLKTLPDFKPGFVVKVHQRIKEGGKERVQVFEGLVIARKGGTGANATFMVRKISYGVGVERIFPLHSPNIVKLDVIKPAIVSKAKLYYTRKRLDSVPRFRQNKQTKKAE